MPQWAYLLYTPNPFYFALGKTVAVLWGKIDILKAKNLKNKKGKTPSIEIGRTLIISDKEGKPVAGLVDGIGGKQFAIYNKEGQSVAELWSSLDGGGRLDIYNKHGKEVVTVQANPKNDGVIVLFDRYGDFGWGMTGKK